jgi:hypothetical protein
MPTDSHIEASFDGETTIEFPSEGVTTSATVTRVGERLYRLDTVPVMIESASFRDVIEADEVGEKTLRFRQVAQKSGWQVFDFILARDVIESEKISKVLRRVEEIGGHWERIFGGCLFICIPPEEGWNPTGDVVG